MKINVERVLAKRTCNSPAAAQQPPCEGIMRYDFLNDTGHYHGDHQLDTDHTLEEKKKKEDKAVNDVQTVIRLIVNLLNGRFVSVNPQNTVSDWVNPALSQRL